LKGFRRFIHPKVLLLSAIFAGQVAYSVYVGGDVWEWMSFSNRYITIAIPGLFVVLSLTVVASFQTDKKMLLAVLPALGLGLFVHSLYYFTVKPQILAAAGLILTGALITLGGFGLISLDRNRRLSPTIGILAVSLLVCLALNFLGVSNWLMGRNNGHSIFEDAETSRRGLLLKQATSPDTTIAYVRAGAMPYFAERKAIDLLGKNDRVIAKGALPWLSSCRVITNGITPTALANSNPT
jgi:hypothetical protein